MDRGQFDLLYNCYLDSRKKDLREEAWLFIEFSVNLLNDINNELKEDLPDTKTKKS